MKKLERIKKEIKNNKSYKNACLVLVGAIFLALICEIKYISENKNLEITEVIRGNQGSLIEEKTIFIKNDMDEEMLPITIQIDPLELSDEEVRQKWDELERKLESLLLGENKSADCVTNKLDFLSEIDGYPFILSYYPENEEYISKEGEIGLGVPEAGAKVRVIVKAKCLSPVFSASKELDFTVINLDEKNGFRFRLNRYINEVGQDTKDKREIELPEEFEGKKLIWERKVENRSLAILLIGVLAASALVIGKREEEEKEKKKKQNEIEQTYPEVISRLAMYMGAGMTVSAAFRRIGEVYEKQEGSNTLKKEIIQTKREIESGIAEADALKGLANRCKSPQLSKLSSIIIQGSRRGTFGLKDMLKEETKDALQERKNTALRMGEKAGTKLLIPMILMLIMVMAIIMIPAFTSFGI